MQRQDSLIESLKGEIVRLKNNVTENQVKQQADIQRNMNQIKMMKEQASESSWWVIHSLMGIHLEVDLI